MKIKNAPLDSSLVVLHDQAWLDRQRIAGKAAAGALVLLEQLVKDKTIKSLLELDQIAEQYIVDRGCSGTFKGYKGFPNCCCISIDNENSHALVHGIPTDYQLQEGDLVSFDLGATYEGAIADTAITCIFGEPKSEAHVRLVKATEEALMKGIEAIVVGKRLGVIGNAIYKHANSCGFNLITKYGGHSITYDTPHAAPFVPNKSNADEGVRIQAGMVLAVEPMLTIGGTKTWVDKDGWTVMCEASASAHFEHSLFVHPDHIEIITDRKNPS